MDLQLFEFTMILSGVDDLEEITEAFGDVAAFDTTISVCNGQTQIIFSRESDCLASVCIEDAIVSAMYDLRAIRIRRGMNLAARLLRIETPKAS